VPTLMAAWALHCDIGCRCADINAMVPNLMQVSKVWSRVLLLVLYECYYK